MHLFDLTITTVKIKQILLLNPNNARYNILNNKNDYYLV